MNKVVLMGRLTKDPELRYTNNTNTAVCSFTIAVDRRFKQEGQPTADFISCMAWTKTAEFISKYFVKGSRIGICGRIQTRSWDDNEGKKHYVTEVVTEEAYFTDSKKSDDMPYRGNQGFESSQQEGFYQSDDDDELPF